MTYPAALHRFTRAELLDNEPVVSTIDSPSTAPPAQPDRGSQPSSVSQYHALILTLFRWIAWDITIIECELTNMVHPLKKLVKWLPDSIVKMARDTPLERLYYNQVWGPDRWQTVSVKTEVGEFDLTVPQDMTIPGGGSYTEDVHEPILVNTLSEVVDEETVFYDIGSRYGYFIGIAKLGGVSPPRIHAFEQQEAAFDILNAHWGNQVEYLNHCYVGNSPGQLRIDDYITNHDAPNVMKIDVEGAELSVLLSAVETISSHRPHIFVEIHPRLLAKEDVLVDDIVALLKEHDYQFCWADHRSDKFDWQQYIQSELPTNTTYILYASPE